MDTNIDEDDDADCLISYLPAFVVVGQKAESREASAGERLSWVWMFWTLVAVEGMTGFNNRNEVEAIKQNKYQKNPIKSFGD